MAVTLGDLRARCRLVLPSVTVWPQAVLESWIGDAIRFYSVEFPRALRHEYDLTTGTQAYDLPAGCVSVRAVEYPAGEAPAVYLLPVDEWSTAFQAGGPVYALRGIADDVAAEEDVASLALVFAQDVATGEHALVSYQGLHRIPSGDLDYLSVPEQHIEALIAFVDFRAHWALETDEAVTLTTVSIILSQLGQEARMAWRRYKEITDRLQALTPGPGGRVVWGGFGL